MIERSPVGYCQECKSEIFETYSAHQLTAKHAPTVLPESYEVLDFGGEQ